MAARIFAIWILLQSICAKAARIDDTLMEESYDDDYDDDDDTAVEMQEWLNINKLKGDLNNAFSSAKKHPRVKKAGYQQKTAQNKKRGQPETVPTENGPTTPGTKRNGPNKPGSNT